MSDHFWVKFLKKNKKNQKRWKSTKIHKKLIFRKILIKINIFRVRVYKK